VLETPLPNLGGGATVVRLVYKKSNAPDER
jgi:hypothetical protein